MRTDLVDRLRAICAAVPGVVVEERPSHGSPAWFARGKQFVHFWDNHHQDGLLCIWAAAPEGAQEMLVSAAPERFFRPPYVGHRGWVGMRLDGDVDWDEVAAVVERAAATVTARRAP